MANGSTPRYGTRALALLYAAAVLVPLCVLTVAGWVSYQQAADDAKLRAVRAAEAIKEHALRTLRTHELIIDFVARYVDGWPWERINTAPELHALLASLDRPSDDVSSIFLLTPDGRNFMSSRRFPMPPIDVTDRDYFRALAARNEMVVTEPSRGRLSGDRVFVIAKRRPAADGRFDGIVAVSANPEYFERFYAGMLESDEDAVALVRADGVMLVRAPALDAAPVRLPPTSGLTTAVAANPVAGTFRVRAVVDGVERIYAYQRVGEYPVYASYALSEKVVWAAWRRSMLLLGAACLAAMVALLFAAHFAGQRARREWAAVARHAEEVERRQAAEGRLRHAQRLEALGRLTGGVAHDFNNVLQVLKGNAQLLRRLAPPELGRFVDAIDRAVGQGSRLTRQLLAFSRRQSLRPVPVDLSERVPEIAELMRRSLGQEVALETRVEPGVPPVRVDPDDFELALMNLGMNARDAMPDGGLVAIEVRRADAAPAADGKGLAGPVVAVTVRDTGAGIAPDVIDKIFDPFFTTKPAGKGTGLGLSQVYGFAAQSGGTVGVESAPGVGTAITLWLPATDAVPEALTEAATEVPPAPPRQAPPAAHGAGVLVVDDVEASRAAVAEFLAALGYRVRQAASGAEAIALFDAGEAFDIVLSDIVMPGMDGHALARTLRKRFPRLPVLLATGFSAAVEAALAEGFEVVHKPYDLDELVAAIERRLAADTRIAASGAG